MLQPRVFGHLFEALFQNALAGRLSPIALEQLRRLGVDVSKRLEPVYPLPLWMAALTVAARDVYPSLELDQAYEQLGEACMEGFSATLVGRAVVAALRLIGPERAMLQAQSTFRSTNNYAQLSHRKVGPGHFRIWINEVGHCPTFTVGMLRAGLGAAGAPSAHVEVAAYDGHGCTYDVRWEDAA
jgi:uncharacterized protein (TIGR02265 family)